MNTLSSSMKKGDVPVIEDQQLLDRETLNLIFSNALTGTVGALLSSTLAVAGLWSAVPQQILLGWYIALVVSLVYRIGLTALFNRDASRFSERTWKRLYTAGVVCTAAIWGTSAFLLYPAADIARQTFLAFVLGGMAAGAVGTYPASFVLGASYVTLCILPITLRFFTFGSVDHTIMGLLATLYMAVLLVSSWRIHSSFISFLQLRGEKENLVKTLQRANVRADLANRGLQEAVQEANRQAQMAREANEAKTTFLANMSHEVRTPLNHVIGLTEMVLDESRNEEHREHLATVVRSARKLLEMMNNILDLSRIESAELQLVPAEIDLRKLLEEIREAYIEVARKKGLTLTVNIDGTLPAHVVGDPVRLRQVLVNLIDNALKFTSQGGVVVHVKPQGTSKWRQEIMFSVIDSGIGIDDEKRDTIFERFVQADGSTTRQYGGVGIGLSIAASLVDLMGGRLNVESPASGGSCFTFSLVFDFSGKEVTA